MAAWRDDDLRRLGPFGLPPLPEITPTHLLGWRVPAAALSSRPSFGSPGKA